MSKGKLSMRKVSEVARLNASGLSNRKIASSCQIARSTVADYLERLKDNEGSSRLAMRQLVVDDVWFCW